MIEKCLWWLEFGKSITKFIQIPVKTNRICFHLQSTLKSKSREQNEIEQFFIVSIALNHYSSPLTNLILIPGSTVKKSVHNVLEISTFLWIWVIVCLKVTSVWIIIFNTKLEIFWAYIYLKKSPTNLSTQQLQNM